MAECSQNGCTCYYPDNQGETTSWGYASWFCCGSAYTPYCAQFGSGLCDTCDSHNYQCAWPNIGSPNLANICRPDLPAYACGDNLLVGNHCVNGVASWVCVEVATRGPNTNALCNQSSVCEG